jgi:hypothetical protein
MFLLALILSFLPLTARAVFEWEPGTQLPAAPGGYVLGNDLDSLIQYVYAWLLGLGGLFAFLRLTMAGIVWGGAGGNVSKVQDAQQIIKSVISGLAILLFSWLVLNTINPAIVNPDIRFPAEGSVIKSSDQATVEPFVEGQPGAALSLLGGSWFSQIFNNPNTKIVETERNKIINFEWSVWRIRIPERRTRNLASGSSSANCDSDEPPKGVEPDWGGGYAFPMAGYFPNVTCSHWDKTLATDISSGATGLDQKNLPIVAYIDGEITYARDEAPADNPGGKIIYLQGNDGKFYYYAHMCKVFVSAGQLVNAGEVIGLSGRTGSNASVTAEHLHFAVDSSGTSGFDDIGAGNICPSKDLGSHFPDIKNQCADKATQCCGNPC